MTFFENELRKMVGEVYPDMKYIGRSAYVELDGWKTAKFQIITQGIADEYTALKVKIISKNKGTLDTTVIRFAEVFCQADVPDPHVWTDKDNDVTEWFNYIPTPQDYAALHKAIKEYTDIFMPQPSAYGRDQIMH